MFRFAAAICGLILLTAGPSWAAAAAPPIAAAPVTSDAPDFSERLALARRYFVAAHLDASIDLVLKNMMPVMSAQILKSYPDLSEADRVRLTDVVSVATRQGMADVMPEYIESVARVVAKVYSLEELKALVGFYESPLGKSVISKNAQMAAPVTAILQGLLPKLETSIERHICEHMKCGSADDLASHHES